MTTRRSTPSVARPSTTSWASATDTRRPGRWSSAGTIDRRRRSSTPPIGSSGSTTLTGSRFVPGSASGCGPSARTRTPAPVRLEAFATGAEEADWIAAEIGRRIEAGAAPRDHAILVRANGHADAYLRALNVAGMPWRFSGASGLYARPEVRLLLAFLRVVAEPSIERGPVRAASRPRCTALAARTSPRSSTWPAGATARSGTSSTSSTSSPGSCGSRRSRGRPSIALVGDLRGYVELAHERPAGELLYAFLRGTGIARPAWPRPTRPRPSRRSRTSRASSRSSAAQSALLADDRAVFVAPHLADAHRGGRRSGHGRPRPRRRRGGRPDRPQGEGSGVPGGLPPGLVAGRFPGRRSTRALPLPAGLGRGAHAGPDGRSPRNAGCATWP